MLLITLAKPAPMNLPLQVVLALFVALTITGCELPQNKTDDGSDASSTTDGGETIREWRYLTIADEAPMTAADGLPGADIDAIVIHRNGEFISAGCVEVSLFGEDSLNHSENSHVDPDGATLWVREQSEESGFVSLAGGTLLCELPLPIQTGDDVTVWEVPSDAADSFSVSFSTDPSGGESASAGSFVSTHTFPVP